MSTGAAEAALDILDKCEGEKLIAMATYPLPDPPAKTFVLSRTMIHSLSRNIEYFIKSKTRGIRLGVIFESRIVDSGVGRRCMSIFWTQHSRTRVMSQNLSRRLRARG